FGRIAVVTEADLSRDEAARSVPVEETVVVHKGMAGAGVLIDVVGNLQRIQRVPQAIGRILVGGHWIALAVPGDDRTGIPQDCVGIGRNRTVVVTGCLEAMTGHGTDECKSPAQAKANDSNAPGRTSSRQFHASGFDEFKSASAAAP